MLATQAQPQMPLESFILNQPEKQGVDEGESLGYNQLRGHSCTKLCNAAGYLPIVGVIVGLVRVVFNTMQFYQNKISKELYIQHLTRGVLEILGVGLITLLPYDCFASCMREEKSQTPQKQAEFPPQEKELPPQENTTPNDTSFVTIPLSPLQKASKDSEKANEDTSLPQQATEQAPPPQPSCNDKARLEALLQRLGCKKDADPSQVAHAIYLGIRNDGIPLDTALDTVISTQEKVEDRQNYDPGKILYHLSIEYVPEVKADSAQTLDRMPIAARILKLASSLGNAQAMGRLGYMNQLGNGIPQDANEAIDLYKKGAAQGDPKSPKRLARWYKERDSILANVWIERAHEAQALADPVGLAHKIYTKACHNSSYLEESLEKITTFKDSVAQEALYQLGLQYYNAGVPTTAVRLFTLAINRGHTDALWLLGTMYDDGRGVAAQDPTRAVKLYQQASDKNSYMGRFWLATMYEQGRGLPQDRQQATQLYHQTRLKQNLIDATFFANIVMYRLVHGRTTIQEVIDQTHGLDDATASKALALMAEAYSTKATSRNLRYGPDFHKRNDQEASLLLNAASSRYHPAVV